MTNNTIPNVPRELLADLLGNDHDKRIMAERHLLAMLANAPSPAGVDGLEVETYLHTMHMERGQTEQFCSKWKGDPFGVSGVDYSSTYSVTSEPLCRLSDAQAIIDGLRGEVDKLMTTFVRVADHLHIDCEKAKSAPGKPSDVFIAAIDQHVKRIGELEGLLREARKDKTRLDQIVMHGISVSAQLKSGEFCGPRGREWRVFKYGKEFSVYGETLREALDKAINAMSAGKEVQ